MFGAQEIGFKVCGNHGGQCALRGLVLVQPLHSSKSNNCQEQGERTLSVQASPPVSKKTKS